MIDILDFFETSLFCDLNIDGKIVKGMTDDKNFPHVYQDGTNYFLSKFDFELVGFCVQASDLMYMSANELSKINIKTYVTVKDYITTNSKTGKLQLRNYIGDYKNNYIYQYIDILDFGDYYGISEFDFLTIRADLTLLRLAYNNNHLRRKISKKKSK